MEGLCTRAALGPCTGWTRGERPEAREEVEVTVQGKKGAELGPGGLEKAAA